MSDYTINIPYKSKKTSMKAEDNLRDIKPKWVLACENIPENVMSKATPNLKHVMNNYYYNDTNFSLAKALKKIIIIISAYSFTPSCRLR